MCVFGAPRLFDKRCRSAIGPRPRTTAIHYHTGNSERRPLPARGYHHLNGCGTPTFGLRFDSCRKTIWRQSAHEGSFDTQPVEITD